MTKSPIQNNYNFSDAVNAADTASNLVNGFIVTPVVNMGIAGFRFDIEDSTTIDLESEITDHYTEGNKAIQDNIALKPEIITLRGYVGELVYRNEKPKGALEKLTEKISTINAFVPVITASAKQTKDFLSKSASNTQDYYAQGVATGVDLYQTFQTLNPPKTNQAKAFNFFKSLWRAKQLVSLETPYTFYKNMAILLIKAIQTGENKEVSDFSITLKQINFAKTSVVKFNPELYQGRAKSEIAEPKNIGKTDGKVQGAKEKAKSLLAKIFS